MCGRWVGEENGQIKSKLSGEFETMIDDPALPNLARCDKPLSILPAYGSLPIAGTADYSYNYFGT